MVSRDASASKIYAFIFALMLTIIGTQVQASVFDGKGAIVMDTNQAMFKAAGKPTTVPPSDAEYATRLTKMVEMFKNAGCAWVAVKACDEKRILPQFSSKLVAAFNGVSGAPRLIGYHVIEADNAGDAKQEAKAAQDVISAQKPVGWIVMPCDQFYGSNGNSSNVNNAPQPGAIKQYLDDVGGKGAELAYCPPADLADNTTDDTNIPNTDVKKKHHHWKKAHIWRAERVAVQKAVVDHKTNSQFTVTTLMPRAFWKAGNPATNFDAGNFKSNYKNWWDANAPKRSDNSLVPLVDLPQCEAPNINESRICAFWTFVRGFTHFANHKGVAVFLFEDMNGKDNTEFTSLKYPAGCAKIAAKKAKHPKRKTR